MDTDGKDAARTPPALECGDLSPLFGLADLSAKQRRVERRDGTPEPNASFDARASPRLTATSRLRKAVTSHRIPKLRGDRLIRVYPCSSVVSNACSASSGRASVAGVRVSDEVQLHVAHGLDEALQAFVGIVEQRVAGD